MYVTDRMTDRKTNWQPEDNDQCHLLWEKALSAHKLLCVLHTETMYR